MAATEARRDLIRKLDLEKKLIRRIARINNKIVNGTIKKFANDGLPFDASLLEGNFEETLNAHYETTGKIFSDQIISELPADIAVTAAEETLIKESLTAYFIARAAEQARIITETNQKNVDESVAAARETTDEDGKPLPRRDQAREAGARTSRKLKGRERGISNTETQNAAETAKGTEAEVLSGRQPSIIAGSPGDAGVDKEWVTFGDEKVRDDHVFADSQIRDLSKPFTVGGQLLRWPGDTALGASVGNVINCRCSSIYDAQAVFAIRRKRAADAVTDREPGEQLLESIG